MKAGILPGHSEGSAEEQPEATVETLTKEVLLNTGTEGPQDPLLMLT